MQVLHSIFYNLFKTLMTIFFVDYATGFGGKYGVQTDRKDKSALGWDHQESLSQHDSQKGKQLHI